MFDKESQPGVASDAAKSLVKANLETFHREAINILSSQSPALLYKQQRQRKFDCFYDAIQSCQTLQRETNDPAFRTLAAVAEEWQNFKQRGESELDEEDDEYLDQLILDIIRHLKNTAAHLIALIRSAVTKCTANDLLSTSSGGPNEWVYPGSATCPINISASDDGSCSTDGINSASSISIAGDPCETEITRLEQPAFRTNSTEQPTPQPPPAREPVVQERSPHVPEIERPSHHPSPATEQVAQELSPHANETERPNSDPAPPVTESPPQSTLLAEPRKRKWVTSEHDSTSPRTTLTLDFADVYQDGRAATKYIILESQHCLTIDPTVSGRWWIARCEICDFHAAHPSNRTAQLAGLHMARHPHLKTGGDASTLDAMGVLVLNCDENLAKTNNESVWAAIANGYEPKTKTPRRKKRKTKMMRFTVPSKKSTEPPIITDPSVGRLYLAHWPDGHLYAALVVPLGDFDRVGIEGSLQESDLLDELPPCYQFDKARGKFCWKKGYEDGGVNVSDRMFPVFYFDRTAIKDCRFSWAQASDLQYFDMNKVLDKHKPVVNEFIHDYQSGIDLDYKPFSFELSQPEELNMTRGSNNMDRPAMVETEISVTQLTDQLTARDRSEPTPSNPQNPTSVASSIPCEGRDSVRGITTCGDQNPPCPQPQPGMMGSQSFEVQQPEDQIVDSSATAAIPGAFQRSNPRGQQVQFSVPTNSESIESRNVSTLHPSVGNIYSESTTHTLTGSQSQNACFGSGRYSQDERPDLMDTQSTESQRLEEVLQHCPHSRSDSMAAGLSSPLRSAVVSGQVGRDYPNSRVVESVESNAHRILLQHDQIEDDPSAYTELIMESSEAVTDRVFRMPRELTVERPFGPNEGLRAQVAQMTVGSTSGSPVPEFFIQQDNIVSESGNITMQMSQHKRGNVSPSAAHSRNTSGLVSKVNDAQNSQQSQFLVFNPSHAISSVDISMIDGLAPDLHELITRTWH